MKVSQLQASSYWTQNPGCQLRNGQVRKRKKAKVSPSWALFFRCTCSMMKCVGRVGEAWLLFGLSMLDWAWLRNSNWSGKKIMGSNNGPLRVDGREGGPLNWPKIVKQGSCFHCGEVISVGPLSQGTHPYLWPKPLEPGDHSSCISNISKERVSPYRDGGALLLDG